MHGNAVTVKLSPMRKRLEHEQEGLLANRSLAFRMWPAIESNFTSAKVSSITRSLQEYSFS